MNMPAAELTALDRCDRCGAPALSVATKYHRSDLLFCGHHLREFFEPLVEDGWVVHSNEEFQMI